MVMRLFLIYAVVEMAVIVALTATIGFGATVLALLGAFVLGLALAGSQLRRQVAQLRTGMRDPGAAVTDSALVALGTVLVFVPGLVTTVAGLLMLTPPTRAAVRPIAGALAARRLSRHVAFVGPRDRRREYIDGEVLGTYDEVYDPEPSPSPMRPAITPKPE
jgi:UPF0716 protein FxsA